MEAEVVQHLLCDFQHVETESADETIERFEMIVERCHQQGVPATKRQQQRMWLSKPNERYIYLKKNFQHVEVKPSLASLYASMRDDDTEHQKTNQAPVSGSATFLNAVTAQAEIIWTQRSQHSRQGGVSGSTKTDSICYNCNQKSHFARECKLHRTQCDFFHRRSHVEADCRSKKREQPDSSNPKASFFFKGVDGISMIVGLY